MMFLPTLTEVCKLWALFTECSQYLSPLRLKSIKIKLYIGSFLNLSIANKLIQLHFYKFESYQINQSNQIAILDSAIFKSNMIIRIRLDLEMLILKFWLELANIRIQNDVRATRASAYHFSWVFLIFEWFQLQLII